MHHHWVICFSLKSENLVFPKIRCNLLIPCKHKNFQNKQVVNEQGFTLSRHMCIILVHRPQQCLGRMCLKGEHRLQTSETWQNVFFFTEKEMLIPQTCGTRCLQREAPGVLLGFSKCNYTFMSWVKLLVLNSLKAGESLPLNFNFPVQLLPSGTSGDAQNSFADCTELLWVYTSIRKGRIWF